MPHICMPCAAVHEMHWLLVQTWPLLHALLHGAEQVPVWKLQFMPPPQGPEQPLPQLLSLTTTHLLELGQRFCPLAQAFSVPALAGALVLPGAVRLLDPPLDTVVVACVASPLMWLAAAAMVAAALTAAWLPPTMPPDTPAEPTLPSVAELGSAPGIAPTVAEVAEPAVSTLDDLVACSAASAEDAAGSAYVATAAAGCTTVAGMLLSGLLPSVVLLPVAALLPTAADMGGGVAASALLSTPPLPPVCALPCAMADVDTAVAVDAAGSEPPHIAPPPPPSVPAAWLVMVLPPLPPVSVPARPEVPLAWVLAA